MGMEEQVRAVMTRLQEEGSSTLESEVRAAFRTVVHDFNNPIGSIAMELYSVGTVEEAVRQLVSEGADPAAIQKELDELRDIVENLSRATERLTDMVKGIDRATCAPEGPSGGAG
ncbi:MAG: hypothetical protein KC416_01265 [Myxococcales bacterium]|nr:hypothetical protein [Myxococcales bacterium]